jgi:uncharacterized damage-inducible protein DinB
MPSPEELNALAAHMEWADAQVWATALQSSAARGDERLRGWLHHLHTVQRAFTSFWRQQPPNFADLASFDGLPALATWGRAGLADLRTFLATADGASMTRVIELPWAQRFAPTGSAVVHPTLAETALHLSIHTAHHRGQVNARLRELGAEPPLVDYIAWIWKGRPDPLWPRNVPPPTSDDRVTG